MLFLTLNDDLLQMVYEYLLFTDMYRLRLTCKDGNRLFRKVGLKLFRKRVDDYLQAGIEGATLESALEESNFGAIESKICIELRNLDFLYDNHFSFRNINKTTWTTWCPFRIYLNNPREESINFILKALGWNLFLLEKKHKTYYLAGMTCLTPTTRKGIFVHVILHSYEYDLTDYPVILLSKTHIEVNDDKFHLRQTI